MAAGQKSREVKIIDVMSSLRKPLSVQREVIYDVGDAGECLDSFEKASPFAQYSPSISSRIKRRNAGLIL